MISFHQQIGESNLHCVIVYLFYLNLDFVLWRRSLLQNLKIWKTDKNYITADRWNKNPQCSFKYPFLLFWKSQYIIPTFPSRGCYDSLPSCHWLDRTEFCTQDYSVTGKSVAGTWDLWSVPRHCPMAEVLLQREIQC